MFLIFVGCGTSGGSSAPYDQPDAGIAASTIPISMLVLPSGNAVATVQVSIGGSAPFTALLDTGSVGLRVLAGTVGDRAWHVGSQVSSITYGSGVIASGVIATASVTIGGEPTSREIAVEDVTSIACTAARPNCPAAGKQVSEFRFGGTFPAILGVGMRATAEIASPLVAIGDHQQYVLALPALDGSLGQITIDPDPMTLARFSGDHVVLSSRGAGFDDTHVPFCLNALCANGLLDTGQSAIVTVTSDPADFAKLGVPNGSSVVPAGTAVTVGVSHEAWSFEVSNPPRAGRDLIRLDAAGGGGTVKNLGIAPFHILDVCYDYRQGTIGLARKL